MVVATAIVFLVVVFLFLGLVWKSYLMHGSLLHCQYLVLPAAIYEYKIKWYITMKYLWVSCDRPTDWSAGIAIHC